MIEIRCRHCGVATALLVLHMQPTSYVASVAANTTLSPGVLPDVRIQLVADAGAAIVLLVIATVLSVYKPRGLTCYGWDKEQKWRGDLSQNFPYTNGVTP